MSKKWGKNKVNLQAAADAAEVAMCGNADPAELVMDALAAGENKLPTFSMSAYNGGPFRPGGWYAEDPIIVDLEGMTLPAQVPIDSGHMIDVGHTTKLDKSAKSLRASGLLSSYSEAADDEEAIAARMMVRKAKNGFPFQASIDFTATRAKIDFFRAGESVMVNGRNFKGPVYVARASNLRKIAILSSGADSTTETKIAAKPGEVMNLFEQWLHATGFEQQAVTDGQRKFLQSAYDAELKAKATPQNQPPAVTVPDAVAEMRAASVAESGRIASIAAACTKAGNPEVEIGGVKVNLQAHAIAEGWTADKVQLKSQEILLAALQADRAKAPTFHMGSTPAATAEVLTAALCRSRMLPNIEKQFKPEVLEASDRYKGMGLQQCILECAAANGYQLRRGEKVGNGNFTEIMAFAFGRMPMQASGFSSLSLPGILGNVANKELVAGYMQEDGTWRELAKIASVSNFHQQTVYRMLDDMEAEELGPDGEIKHGKVSSESYTRQAKTYAKMFTLTRISVINDDLGAFDDLRTRMGRGQAKKLRKTFWTAFMGDAANFWTSARTNYITGATTTLLVDGVGLGLGIKGFRQMTSPTADGLKRIGGQPSILLHPPELEGAARVLFTERGGQNIATAGNANPWQGIARPVTAVELSDSTYTGYSATAWYLMREPSELAAVHVTFLNGQEMPTVESAETDFNTLGVQFRVYHDFGCDRAEYLAGIKSKGAA